MGLKTNENSFETKVIILMMIIFSGIVYFSYLSRPDNYTRRQVRTVICAREMIASGNYIIPTLRGKTRFRKPPLPYWLISLTAKFNNGHITNTTSRTPSVIAGVLILLLTWWWTLKLKAGGNQKNALLSPLILITIPLFFLSVRSSEAETVLCFFIFFSSYFFWRASTATETSGRNLIYGYLFVAGGFMTKGPLALIMPILPYLIIRKKNLLKEWKWHSIGLVIAIIPVGLWVFAAYIYYPESINVFIKELFTNRFGGGAKHAQPFYYYIILLLGQFALFAPILFLAPKKTFKQKQESKFNLYFVFLNLIWLSLMSSKQKHYIIPLFPHLSIILCVWLSEWANKGWIKKYFNVISSVLAAGVLVFGFSLIPKSIPILMTTITAVIFVMFLSRHLMLCGLWKSAILFLAIMHLGALYVTHTGNRLIYEQLMTKWLNNQVINKNKIVFVKRPKELLAFYLDSVKDHVSSKKDKKFMNKSDYYIIEENEKLYEQFIEDKRFYLVKSIEKIKKGRKENKIALFGKIDAEKYNKFNFRLLFVSEDENGTCIPQDIISNSDLKTYYAMIPEVNPLESLDLFSIGNRMKWEQSYLPILNQGVELICKFDPRSSLFGRAWFNDSACWGVTKEKLQRRSFFKDRYFLWTIDRADIDKGIDQLENELRLSHSRMKLVYFQKSPSNSTDIPEQYIKRLKNLGATIINELISGNARAADMKISYDELTIQSIDSKGKIISFLNNANTGIKRKVINGRYIPGEAG